METPEASEETVNVAMKQIEILQAEVVDLTTALTNATNNLEIYEQRIRAHRQVEMQCRTLLRKFTHEAPPDVEDILGSLIDDKPVSLVGNCLSPCNDENYVDEVKRLRREVESLEKQNKLQGALEAEVTTMREQHSREVASLKVRHEVTIQKLSKEHQEEISSLRRLHSRDQPFQQERSGQDNIERSKQESALRERCDILSIELEASRRGAEVQACGLLAEVEQYQEELSHNLLSEGCVRGTAIDDVSVIDDLCEKHAKEIVSLRAERDTQRKEYEVEHDVALQQVLSMFEEESAAQCREIERLEKERSAFRDEVLHRHTEIQTMQEAHHNRCRDLQDQFDGLFQEVQKTGQRQQESSRSRDVKEHKMQTRIKALENANKGLREQSMTLRKFEASCSETLLETKEQVQIREKRLAQCEKAQQDSEAAHLFLLSAVKDLEEQRNEAQERNHEEKRASCNAEAMLQAQKIISRKELAGEQQALKEASTEVEELHASMLQLTAQYEEMHSELHGSTSNRSGDAAAGKPRISLELNELGLGSGVDLESDLTDLSPHLTDLSPGSEGSWKQQMRSVCMGLQQENETLHNKCLSLQFQLDETVRKLQDASNRRAVMTAETRALRGELAAAEWDAERRQEAVEQQMPVVEQQMPAVERQQTLKDNLIKVTVEQQMPAVEQQKVESISDSASISASLDTNASDSNKAGYNLISMSSMLQRLRAPPPVTVRRISGVPRQNSSSPSYAVPRQTNWQNGLRSSGSTSPAPERSARISRPNPWSGGSTSPAPERTARIARPNPSPTRSAVRSRDRFDFSQRSLSPAWGNPISSRGQSRRASGTPSPSPRASAGLSAPRTSGTPSPSPRASPCSSPQKSSGLSRAKSSPSPKPSPKASPEASPRASPNLSRAGSTSDLGEGLSLAAAAGRSGLPIRSVLAK